MKLRKLLIIFGLLFSNHLSFCQSDTIIYYNLLDSVLKDETNAVKYSSLTKKGKSNYKLFTYILDEKKWIKESCISIKRINENHFEFDNSSNVRFDVSERVIINHENGQFYIQDISSDGQIMQEGYSEMIFPLIKTGKWIRYSFDNYKISEDFYEKNKLIRNTRFTKEGKEDIHNVFYFAEEMPMYGNTSFKDFTKLFLTRLQYPRNAAENGIQGEIQIEFVIMEDGRMDGFQILKNANNILNVEAIKTLTTFNEKWAPGKINGKPVRVLYSLSVNFFLQ